MCAFNKYHKHSDLHFFQFDYAVRTQPETWEPAMKHTPADTIIANMVITPLTRAFNALPNVSTPGMPQRSWVKNRGSLFWWSALLLSFKSFFSLGRSILPISVCLFAVVVLVVVVVPAAVHQIVFRWISDVCTAPRKAFRHALAHYYMFPEVSKHQFEENSWHFSQCLFLSFFSISKCFSYPYQSLFRNCLKVQQFLRVCKYVYDDWTEPLI